MIDKMNAENLKKGDSIALITPMGEFENVGEICEIVNVMDDSVSFKFGGVHLGCVSYDELNKHFAYIEKPCIVTDDDINDIMSKATINTHVIFDKCLVMEVQLLNGYVIVESSACVSPECFDREIGYDICYKNIVKKVVEHLAYNLHNQISGTLNYKSIN